jgi:hypothetical protein
MLGFWVCILCPMIFFLFNWQDFYVVFLQERIALETDRLYILANIDPLPGIHDIIVSITKGLFSYSYFLWL